MSGACTLSATVNGLRVFTITPPPSTYTNTGVGPSTYSNSGNLTISLAAAPSASGDVSIIYDCSAVVSASGTSLSTFILFDDVTFGTVTT